MATRIRGASPEWMQQLQKQGYDHVPLDKLIAFRIHGVSPEFIQKIQGLGYKHPEHDQLIAASEGKSGILRGFARCVAHLRRWRSEGKGFPALTGWANLCRASGAMTRLKKTREAPQLIIPRAVCAQEIRFFLGFLQTADSSLRSE